MSLRVVIGVGDHDVVGSNPQICEFMSRKTVYSNGCPASERVFVFLWFS